MMSEKNKSQLLIVGFVGAVLMVIVLYCHFMIGRGYVNDYDKRSTRVAGEIEESRAELADIQAMLAQEDLLEEQRAMIAKVTKRLPNSPDAPGFLTTLLSALRQTGIIQELVRPERPASRTQYTEIPYRIQAQGRYHELGQFLTFVEQNPDRFMRIKSFTVRNSLERPSVHPIEMEIATFMFTNRSPGAQPERP